MKTDAMFALIQAQTACNVRRTNQRDGRSQNGRLSPCKSIPWAATTSLLESELEPSKGRSLNIG